MATRTVVVLVCDVCKNEGNDIENHALSVDNRPLEVDTCAACWKDLTAALAPAYEGGRAPEGKRKRRLPTQRVSSKSA